MANVKLKFLEVKVGDEDSVHLVLDFDKVKNPQKVVDTIYALKDWREGSLDFWDLVLLMRTIWRG